MMRVSSRASSRVLSDHRYRHRSTVTDIADRFLRLLPTTTMARAGQSLVDDGWLDAFGLVVNPPPGRKHGAHHEATAGRKLRTLEPTLTGLFPCLTAEPRLLYVLPQ